MRHLLVVLLLFPAFLFSQNFNHQPDWRSLPGQDFGDLKWYEIMDREGVTFDDMRKAFYKEWENKEYEKGKGFKQFKRLEAVWVNKKDAAFKRNVSRILQDENLNRSSAAANWTLLGPTSPPDPPQGTNYTGWNNEGVGRVDVIEFDPNNATTIYAGTPNGGLWKSTDDGANWNIISNSSWPNQGVSDVLVDPNNSNTIYALTGTREGGGFSAEGMMKSTDGGSTWTNTPFPSETRMYRIIIDPNNSSKLIIGANSGVYYSTNSGATWTLASGTLNAIKDVEFKPGSSSVLYSASDTQIFKSTNGGTSWSALTVPFTTAQAGRISVAVSASNPSAAFFMVGDGPNNTLLGLYKTPDEGSSFSSIADLSKNCTYVDGTAAGTLGSFFWGQLFYDWTLAVNPANENQIIMGDISAFRTDDGGTNWKIISSSSLGGGSIHVDMHHANYNPVTNVPYIGCDGGLYKFISDGTQWARLNDMSISQMYTLAASQMNPEVVVCGLQDNGMFYYDNGIWNGVRIGDVLSVGIDPVDPSVIYGATTRNDMALFKSTNKGASWTDILLESETGETAGSFTQPRMALDPCLRHVIYSAFSDVYKSVDGGENWTNLSNGTAGTSFKYVLEVAPSDPNYIYTSTSVQSEGGIYYSSDGGTSWNSANWPTTTYSFMRAMVIDPSDPTHIYTAQSNNGVFESNDSGMTWTNITGTIPAFTYCRDIDYVENSNDELYLATESGVFYKNGTADWVLYNTNLPDVDFTGIQVCEYNQTVKVSSYGRGLWTSPLENSSTACYVAAGISPAGPLNICGTTGVTLTADAAPSGYSYQWYKDDVLISGQTSQTFNPTVEGNYSVIYTSGPCKSYSSDIVKVVVGCTINACADYNTSSASGPGNTTIVSFVGPFETPLPGSMVDICLSIQGDTGDSQEQFNVSDENGVFLASTTPISDCSGKSTVCVQVTDTDFNNWAADSQIDIIFDPVGFAINPFLCSVNEACAEITIQANTSAPCADFVTESNNPVVDGTYQADLELNSSGFIPASGNVIFNAGNQICLDPGFEVSSLATSFEAFIFDCDP